MMGGDAKAVVLCGGRGTRLVPLTNDRQKCMLPVAGKPVLRWVIELFRSHRVRNFLLVAGYRKEDVVEYFRDGSDLGVNIAYAVTEGGTAASLRVAKPWVGEGDFFLANGDLFHNLNVQWLWEVHRTRGRARRAIVTMALVERADPSRFGVAKLDADGTVVQFVEKPGVERAPSRLINAGVMVCSQSVFEHIHRDHVSFELQVLPSLAERGLVQGVPLGPNFYWRDIGSPEDYEVVKQLSSGLLPQG